MIEVRVVDQITPELKSKAQALRSFRQPLKQSQALMLRSVDKNFRAGGRPKWEPLAASTRANRRKGQGIGSPQPLQDTGTLRASIRPLRLTDQDTVIGSSLKYANVHQHGATIQLPEIRPRKAQALRWFAPDGSPVFAKRVRPHTVRIPARPFLVFQDQDERRIVTIFKRYVEEA